MNIKALKTHDEIAQSFDAFLELRPHLRSKEIFVTQVMEQYKEGYEIPTSGSFVCGVVCK